MYPPLRIPQANYMHGLMRDTRDMRDMRERDMRERKRERYIEREREDVIHPSSL